MSSPLLSVCLITYNHVNYIRQAIDGVLMQQTDFDWELIIADDFSTDGTREILLEYRARFPERIRLILQPKNVGAARNWLDLITTPKSKYIAYFEGDDYWTDPLKLQKQVDFLQKNPSIVLSCHHVLVDGVADGSVLSERYFSVEFLAQNHIPTPSVVFRNLLEIRKSDFIDAPVGDFVLWVQLGQYGDFHMMPECMAVYRRHANGIWSGRGRLEQIRLSVEARMWCLPRVERNGFLLCDLKSRARLGLAQSFKRLNFIHFLFFAKVFFIVSLPGASARYLKNYYHDTLGCGKRF